MKKSILLGIISLTAGVATAFGQGYITLDNYFSLGPIATYGANVPANGVSGALGTIGAGLNSAWTAGLYFVGGTTGLVQPAGSDLPDASLSLGTGIGSTTGVASPSVGGQHGFFSSIPAFNTGSTLNTTVTLEIVVYDSAAGSYADALYRVHSAAFSMPTVVVTSGTPAFTGAFMPPGAFVVPIEIPEPAALALGGLGLAALVLARRKKA